MLLVQFVHAHVCMHAHTHTHTCTHTADSCILVRSTFSNLIHGFVIKWYDKIFLLPSLNHIFTFFVLANSQIV